MYIFTEIINAGPVGKIMLGSFIKHHPNNKIHVYGTDDDFNKLDELRSHPNIELMKIDYDTDIVSSFKQGHKGTSMIFAMAFYIDSHLQGQDKVVHIDSDVYFKKPSLHLIEEAFNEGYGIVGSRRCYANNPGKAPVHPGAPDAISTYFTGYDKKYLMQNGINLTDLQRMWEGAYNPLGFPVLDFGDPVCFVMMGNGAKVKYVDSNLIGGQDENGSKVNNYKSNLHFDCGSHLVHFGGVGSGYAHMHGKSHPQSAYAQWSLGRWSLFAKLFYNRIERHYDPCQINEDGRWVNGDYNDEILQQAIKDIA